MLRSMKTIFQFGLACLIVSPLTSETIGPLCHGDDVQTSPTPGVIANATWGRFQNGGQNVAPEPSLATQWSPEDGIAWTADLVGYGQSTPIIAHGQIVLTQTSGENKENYHVVSISPERGELNWQVDLSNPSPFKNSPMVSRAAPTAVATERGFVAAFEGGQIVAIDPSGETMWQINLVEQYGTIEARHGLAASLEIDANRIFVWIERSTDPYVMALDAADGEVLWKSEGLGVTSWASPRLIDMPDSTPHLVCSGSGKIVGFDVDNGDRLWEFSDLSNNSSCTPTPVAAGEFLIGASNGRGETNDSAAAESNGLIRVEGSSEGGFTADYVWRATKATSSFGSPVVIGDTAGFINRAGVLYRLDLATGEETSKDRLDAGGVWATPIVCGNRLYVFGYKGTTSVLDVDTNKEIAVNRCWPEADDNPGFGGGSVLYAGAIDPGKNSADESADGSVDDATGDSPSLYLRRGDKIYCVR